MKKEHRFLLFRIVLGLTFAFEAAFSAAAFIVPEKVLTVMGIEVSPSTLFFGHVFAWFLLAMTLICGNAFQLISENNPAGWKLTKILALWWIGIGLALGVKWGHPENLIFDSLKGLVLLGLAMATQPKRSRG